MPYERPSLPALIDRVRADVISRLEQDDVLRRSDAEVYARAVAGLSHSLHGFVEWLSRQVLPDTAEAEYLDRHASLWGVARKPAAVAVGTVTFTGLSGASVPEGAVLQALDGAQYTTTAAVTLVASTGTAAVVAVVPGAAGNRTAGQTLTLATPILSVQSGGVASALTGGADTEADDALLARLLDRIQRPPHGGASFDYVRWALEVPGVTRAWCYPLELGAGTVTVRFMRDDDATTAIPEPAEVAAVQAYIDSLRPVTAQVTVVAPVAAPLALTIAVTPNTQAVRDAVTAELQDLITREAEPGGTLLLSRIRAAVSAAAGESNNTVASPTADVTRTLGQITTLGAITWA